MESAKQKTTLRVDVERARLWTKLRELVLRFGGMTDKELARCNQPYVKSNSKIQSIRNTASAGAELVMQKLSSDGASRRWLPARLTQAMHPAGTAPETEE